MQLKTESKFFLKAFKYLPSLAAYILKHHLNEFVHLQIKRSYEVDLPLLKVLSHMSEEELFQYSLASNTEWLTLVAQNKIKEQINLSADKWIKNQFEVVDQYDIVSEDISLIYYIRKSGLLHFAKTFFENWDDVFEFIDELDLFISASETSSNQVYINLLKDKVNQHSYAIERITNTSPGMIYLFDLQNKSITYVNKRAEEFFNLTEDEFKAFGSNIMPQLIHPDDISKTLTSLAEMESAPDGEIRVIEHRLQTVEGTYIWHRNYVSVFKRTVDGKPLELIGNVLNINTEKEAAERLIESEEILNQAQALSNIGNYVLNTEDNTLVGSKELFNIYEIPFGNPLNYSLIKALRHPDDEREVEAKMQDSLTRKENFSFQYRILLPDGRQKMLAVKGEPLFNENGVFTKLHGTVQDITERQVILDKLHKSEDRYKQAEALTHIGNFEWESKIDEVIWSDEMFRIFGYEPDEIKVTKEVIIQSIHKEEITNTKETIRSAIEKNAPFDFYTRIIQKNGQERILHVRGSTVKDDKSGAVIVIGTAQDVTEKQTLIRKLKHSESIYKQAEVLANMGNWFWRKNSDSFEWTDQLYKIYGLKPQSEKITIERFLAFVHPEDRPTIEESINKEFSEEFIDYTFRINTADGKIKTIRSIAHAERDKNGNLISISGTEQDITNVQQLIKELTLKEQLYKQAQALAHVGNWSWDIQSDAIEWSDELHRIYGLEPGNERITYDQYVSYLHPDDREEHLSQIQKCLQDHESWNRYHRIILPDGRERIIFSTGEVFLNKEGKPYLMLGTAQDVTERQTMIKKFEESEALYKQAQAIAHLGNWKFDIHTRETKWSEELYRIYEVPLDTKITFDLFLSYLHPDDKDDFINYFENFLKQKTYYDKRHRIVLPSGKIKTLHRRAEIKYNDEGEVAEVVGTTQDITEQQAIENELRDKEIFIKKITDAAPSIIELYNIHTGQFSYISEGISKLLGYNQNDAFTKGVSFFMDKVHPDDKKQFEEKNVNPLIDNNTAENKDSNDIVEYTYRILDSQGNYKWLHTYSAVFDKNSNGIVENVLNISLDVTDQYDATQKIKEQEHFIQHIADASPTVLYVFDIERQRMVYVNREIFFVLGYTPDDLIKMEDSITENLYHPDDFALLPERAQSTKKINATDIMIQYECRLKNSQGDWQWFLVREVVFKTDNSGKIVQIIGAALDISKRKEMEKTLLQNSFQLEQSNASLEEFAYVASHDLKEPLRKISTFGDRLVTTQESSLTPEGKIYLKKIVEASQRMQVMISDLLSISMISGNKEYEDFSLQKILEETLQTLEYKIEKKNAIINAEPLPNAIIVPSQFRQLFQNLLSNSLKFIADDRQPIITIRHSILKAEEVSLFNLGNAENYLKLEFSDNGIGFENEYAGKIFAIFQRLHGRSEYEGSGIGLAICKKIVEHHGGVIYATGIPDEGATFTIFLPL